MNPIGPLPRPDGSQVTQTDATGEARAGPAKKNNTSQHGRSSSSFGQEDLVGLNEGEYAFRPYSMETLDNVQSSTAIPDAETQAALEGLFMESSHHTTNHGETTGGEVGETNLDTTSADGTKKRRPGTSRINMLARGGACEFCKRRKLKCSAEEPSCSACLRANRECVYSQKKQRSKVRQLEDRLADLEKRLEPGITSQEGTPVPATLTEYAARHDPVTSDGFWNRLADIGSTTADLGFTFPGDLTGWGVNGGVLDQNGIETLMTLADAASIGQDGSAKFAWESMSEVEIASEIVKAVEGEKGVGEKIVSHLYVHNCEASPPLEHADRYQPAALCQPSIGSIPALCSQSSFIPLSDSTQLPFSTSSSPDPCPRTSTSAPIAFQSTVDPFESSSDRGKARYTYTTPRTTCSSDSGQSNARHRCYKCHPDHPVLLQCTYARRMGPELRSSISSLGHWDRQVRRDGSEAGRFFDTEQAGAPENYPEE